MGVQLEYPKKIYSIEENREILCNELENYNDVYQVVVERIKQLCRNLERGLYTHTYLDCLKSP